MYYGRKHRTLMGCGVAAALVAVCGPTSMARATDYFWKSPLSGNWTTASNWNGGGFPNAATAHVFIDVPDLVNPQAQYIVTLQNSATFGSLTVDSPNALLKFNSGGQPNCNGPIVVKRGGMECNGAFFFGTPTKFQIDGAGSLHFNNNTTIPAGTPLSNAGIMTVNACTVQSTNSAGITNTGLLTLTGATTAWLYSTNTLFNSGTLIIDSLPGSSHTLSAALNNQAGGTTTVNGGVAVFSGSTVNAGTFRVNALYNLATRAFTHNSGTLNFGSGGRIKCGTLNVNGGIVTGQVNVTGDGQSSTLNINGGTFFGPIVVDGSTNGCIVNVTNPAATGGSLTLFGNVLFPFVTNQAGFDTDIAIKNSGLDPFAPTTVTTQGDQAINGRMNFYSAAKPDGTVVVPVLDVFSGNSFGVGPNGAIDGIGQILCGSKPFTMNGTAFELSDNLSIGPGEILVSTPLVKFDLNAELVGNLRDNLWFRGYSGRAAAVISPRFAATGAVSLDGKLTLKFVDPPTLHVGDSFVVLSGASISGQFASVTLMNAPAGLAFAIDYSTTEVRARVTGVPCMADFDGDGFLTFEDFDAFVAAFEAGAANADFDGDGFLTFEDFDAFVEAFEAGC